MSAILCLAAFLFFQGEAPASLNEDPLAINDEMIHFLDANINRGADSVNQLRELVRVVFENNTLGFSYEPVTRTAIETFTLRRGNCVSFTFLFLALARHLGLDARFREVEIAPLWSQLGGYINLSGHVNVAVVIGTQWYTVDLFPQVNRIELRGLVVSDKRAEAHYFNNRGVDLLASGDSAVAIQYFRKALAIDPALAIAWCNLGVALTHAENFALAEDSYREALRLNPENMPAMSNIASLYTRTGREQEARRWESKARKFRDKNPYYHYSLGLQAFESGDYQAAINHFKDALRRKKNEHNFYQALGKTYLQLGDANRARACLRSALKYAPDATSRLLYSDKLTWLAAQ